jgi:hypothetical protein
MQMKPVNSRRMTAEDWSLVGLILLSCLIFFVEWATGRTPIFRSFMLALMVLVLAIRLLRNRKQKNKE